MTQLTFYGVSCALFVLICGAHALIICQEPPFDAQLFMDLPKLQLLSIKYAGSIQSPEKCSSGNGTSICAKQACCDGEVGCCYGDPTRGSQICGCKKQSDSECTRPAPLFVFRNYGCKPHKEGEISMCLRKNLEGEIVESSITAPNGQLNNALKIGGELVEGATNFVSRSGMNVNDKTLQRLLSGYTVDQLEEMLKFNVLDSLVQRVNEKKIKGLPYGRRDQMDN